MSLVNNVQLEKAKEILTGLPSDWVLLRPKLVEVQNRVAGDTEQTQRVQEIIDKGDTLVTALNSVLLVINMFTDNNH